MARPLRLEFSGAIYHLTGRGSARQKIFVSDADRQLFLDTLARVVGRYGWICHAYCLMANHYHLLVETPKPNLSLVSASVPALGSYRMELCRYIVLKRKARAAKSRTERDPTRTSQSGPSEAGEYP